MRIHRRKWALGSLLVFLRIPLVVAFVADLIWYVLWDNRVFVTPKDGESLHQGLLGVLGSLHALLAALFVTGLWKDVQEALNFIRVGDEHGFRFAIQDRIPQHIHSFMGLLSVLVVTTAMLYPYEIGFTGAFFVGAITIALAGYWQLATFLDDPLRDPCVIAEVPEEWLQRIRRGEPPLDRPKIESGIVIPRIMWR